MMFTTKELKAIHILAACLIALAYSCTPPKTITQSGKVTPKGQVKAGMDYSANVPTHVVRSIYDNVGSIVGPLLSKDTIYVDAQLMGLNRTALAYAIEPIGVGYHYYARYGILKKFDVGYKYASGTHTFDAMYQFMGSTGSINEPGEKKMCGSVGLQFSSKSYELPGWNGLNKAQTILGFEMNRKDFIIPLIFSIPFGPEETIGNFSFGMVYTRSFLNYGFKSNKIFDTVAQTAPVALQSLNNKANYGGVGIFFNLKLGYKYIYALPAFAMYYQNYGSFMLLDGSKAGFRGVTFVPSLGIQINPTQIYYDVRKRKK